MWSGIRSPGYVYVGTESRGGCLLGSHQPNSGGSCLSRTSPPKSGSRRSMCRGICSPKPRQTSPATGTCCRARCSHPSTRPRHRSCQWSSFHQSRGGTTQTKPCADARYSQSPRCLSWCWDALGGAAECRRGHGVECGQVDGTDYWNKCQNRFQCPCFVPQQQCWCPSPI